MAGGVRRPSTLESYQGYIERSIKPYLGDEPVGKLTLEDVRKLYRELQKNRRVAEHPVYGYGLSGTMVRRIHAMEAAVRENLIARNPTEGITRPRRKRPPSRSSTTPS